MKNCMIELCGDDYMVIRPRFFPHHAPYAYSEMGFDRSQRRRLRDQKIPKRIIERLRELYFTPHPEHQNEMGDYVNVRKCKLYYLARSLMKSDRKQPLFEYVVCSGLFFLYVERASGRPVAFRSPWAKVKLGLIF